nr:inositol 1,3,4-trisphosphate 5/6-kinase 4 [Quercus suber]
MPSFHMSISLYQCCKPQAALGSNAILSLNFVLVILHFQSSGHVLQERERVVQDSPCSKYPEKFLIGWKFKKFYFAWRISKLKATLQSGDFLKVDSFKEPDLLQRISEAKLSLPSIVKPQVA